MTFGRARPTLSRNDKIKAHFMACFIALFVYRILAKKTDDQFTCEEMVFVLRDMRVTKAKDIEHLSSYTRTAITDVLHETAGFKKNYKITREKAMKGSIRKSKKR